jgi:uncharacterized membrane protein
MDLGHYVVLLHVLGAFTFVAGHGVSALMAFKLRSERDPVRIGAILDFSQYSMSLMGIGFLVLLASGIASGFIGLYWGDLWLWTSIVLLVVLTGGMTPLVASHYNRVRHAVGIRGMGDKKDAPDPIPASPAELEALLAAPTPWIATAFGGIGFVAIVWLMMAKPF